jgi:hypothetical protein
MAPLSLEVPERHALKSPPEKKQQKHYCRTGKKEQTRHPNCAASHLTQ